jgi:hypothetical protein
VRRIKYAALTLAMLACSGYAAETPQLSPEQAKVLEAARTTAMQYTHLLPDFICTQVTHRVVTKSMDGNIGTGISGRTPITTLSNGIGYQSDVIEEQLTYVGGKESYDVLAVNGKKVKGRDHLELQGATSEGEFGSMLVEVFDPGSRTTFTWSRSASVHGRHAWVYEFHVPRESGTSVIAQDSDKEILVSLTGEVFIDPETNNVLQITSKLDMPSDFPIHVAKRNLEFAPREIAGKTYSVPIRSQVHMEDGKHIYDNQIDFKNYHRFGTESTIHFDNENPQ